MRSVGAREVQCPGLSYKCTVTVTKATKKGFSIH